MFATAVCVGRSLLVCDDRWRGELPEADPRYDNYEGGRYVDLYEVVAHRPNKLELAG